MTKIDGQKARDDASRLISNLGPGGNTNLGDGIIKGLDVSEHNSPIYNEYKTQ